MNGMDKFTFRLFHAEGSNIPGWNRPCLEVGGEGGGYAAKYEKKVGGGLWNVGGGGIVRSA